MSKEYICHLLVYDVQYGMRFVGNAGFLLSREQPKMSQEPISTPTAYVNGTTDVMVDINTFVPHNSDQL